MNLSPKASTKILIGLMLSFIIADASQKAFAHAGNLLLAAAHTFAISFLLFWWVREHAAERSKTPPWGAKFLSGFIAIIGIPYYLYGTYGFKDGSAKLLVGLIVWIAMMVAYSLVASL